MNMKRWEADSVRRFEDGILMETRCDVPFSSGMDAHVHVVLASDYDALAARLVGMTQQVERLFVRRSELEQDAESLRTRLETERADKHAWEDTANSHKGDADSLRSRLAEAERDAKRYRWLREKEKQNDTVAVTFNIGHDWIETHDLDGWIDREIASATSGGDRE